MDAPNLAPNGRALRDFYYNNESVILIIRRDDDLVNILPVGHFFRQPDEFSEIERKAPEWILSTTLGYNIITSQHNAYRFELRLRYWDEYYATYTNTYKKNKRSDYRRSTL